MRWKVLAVYWVIIVQKQSYRKFKKNWKTDKKDYNKQKYNIKQQPSIDFFLGLGQEKILQQLQGCCFFKARHKATIDIEGMRMWKNFGY